MNCPQCRAALSHADARCAQCGFVLASEARSGVPTWVWVAAIVGGILMLFVVFGMLALFVFGHRMAGTIGSSASVLPGSTTTSSSVMRRGDEGVSALQEALLQFVQEHGAPPARLEDLVGARSASGDLLLALDQLPLDAHGRPYVYAFEPEEQGWSLTLTSLGHDGLPGGAGGDQDTEVLAMQGQRR